MNSKWVLFCVLALVVLLVLYGLSVGVGTRERRGREPAGPDERRLSLNAPWVQDLRLRMTTQLKPEELRLVGIGGLWGCRLDGAQITVPVFGFGCEFEIAPADKTRALRMQLVQGQSVSFRLAQKGALTIDDEPLLAGAKPGIYDIYRGEEVARLAVTDCQTDEESEIRVCLISLE